MGIGGKIKWRGAEVQRKLDAAVRRRLGRIGELVASHARRNMSTSNRTNGPSAPGDPYPHADTGRLRNSVFAFVRDDGNGRFAAVVGSNVEYARHVHEGTHGHEGRPFLESAINDKQSAIKRLLSRPLD